MKESKKKASIADVVILLAIMLVAAYMFAASNSFAAETKLFPQIVSAFVFLCCVGKLVLTGLALRAAKAPAGDGMDARAAMGGKQALLTKNQLVVLAVAILYVVLLTPVGFLPSTVAVLIALPCLLGYRRWKVLIPFAVIITVAFYVIFRYGFYIKLPAGILSGIL